MNLVTVLYSYANLWEYVAQTQKTPILLLDYFCHEYLIAESCILVEDAQTSSCSGTQIVGVAHTCVCMTGQMSSITHFIVEFLW